MMQTDNFHLGEIFLKEGKSDEAFLHFADAIGTNPLAYLQLSEMVAKEGNLSHALYLLEQAMIKPDYFDPIFEERYKQLLAQKIKIETQEKIKFKKEKEKEKERAKKEAKQRLAEECFQKGEEAFQQQEYPKAMGFYQQAIEQNSQHWNAHVKFNQSIQKCEFNKENTKSALKSCDIMIGLASSVEHHKNDLALAYCEKGNTQFFLAANQASHADVCAHREQAQKNYEQAIKKDESFSMAYFGLAKCYMRQAASKRKELTLLLEMEEIECGATEKYDADMMALCEIAETYFIRGIETFGIENLLPPDICWELGQLKDAQGDIEAGQKYYAMAFQGDGEIFCALYLEMINKEFVLGTPNLLSNYNFILHNEDFNAYMLSCDTQEEKGGLYFRSAVLNQRYNKPLLAIQQLLLALVCNTTEEQNKYVGELLSRLETYIDFSIFENINHELSAIELARIKMGYIQWVESDLKDKNYEDATKKYELIQGSHVFKAWSPVNFLTNMGNAYGKIKNLEAALVCYQQAAIKCPEDAAIKDKVMQLTKLKDLKLQQVLPELSADEKWVAQGRAAFNLQHYALSLEKYIQALVINPVHGQAHVGAAKCYRRLGEAMMQPHRFTITPTLVGDAQIKQVKIILSKEEGCIYEESEEHFHTAIGIISAPLELAEIYRELGWLYELQGHYRKAIAYFEMSFSGDKGKFYEFYQELTAREFEKKSFHLICRFDYLLHDEAFGDFYIRNTNSVDYKSGMYHSCGYIYNCMGEFDCAIQHYLLALSHSKVPAQIQNIYQSLNNVLHAMAKFGEEMSCSIFKDILNMTSVEELLEIKKAYIKWMRRDLKNGEYQSAIRKFMLLVGDASSHQLMGAKFLCHMGNACVQSDLDLAIACYDAAIDVDPAFESIEPNRKFLRDSKALRDQKRLVESEGEVYTSSRASSPTMYNNCSNYSNDEYKAKSSCNLF